MAEDNFQAEVDSQLARVRAFTDSRIMNTIDQAHNFSQATVEAAKQIAIERGLVEELITSDGIGADASLLYSEALRMLKANVPTKAVYNKLIEMNSNDELVLQELQRATLQVDVTEVGKKEEKSSNSWVWFVVIFIILRVIRSLTN